MRQAGVLAAAGIVALQKMVSRLAEDHANAHRLAGGLARIPGVSIQPERVQSNIVTFDFPSSISKPEFMPGMEARGVRVLYRGGRRIRAVTHRLVSAADIDEALTRIEQLVKELS